VTEISNETRFLHAVEMGLGAWQWGDRMMWQYGSTHTEDDIRKAFETALAEGIRFMESRMRGANASPLAGLRTALLSGASLVAGTLAVSTGGPWFLWAPLFALAGLFALKKS